MSTILITGGTGYIGSHTAVELLNKGYSVVIVDHLTNSNEKVNDRIKEITGKTPEFYNFDLRDYDKLQRLFKENKFDTVIHFAGLKAVGESVLQPLKYYDNNLSLTISLLKAMQEFHVKKIVFSSSATVYGNPDTVEYHENLMAGQHISNPYGQTKYFIEQILKDMSVADPLLEVMILRYFNPIGAHQSGLIGEDPLGVPNNIMPFIAQVASGKREKLSIFGNDYPTSDGTCRRDYIHVVDLARGHIAALEHLSPGTHIYNLGSGRSTSVLELVTTFMKATGVSIPYEFAPRRQGDLSEFYANTEKAKKELGWETELTLDDMCRDTWNWQSKNPNGFQSTSS